MRNGAGLAASRSGLSRAILGLVVVAVMLANLLALLGFLARDRSVPLGMLLYYSMLPIGLPTVILGLECSRRGSVRAGFSLVGLGFLTLTTLIASMTGRNLVVIEIPVERRVRLLHWNTMWAGAGPYAGATSRAVIDAVAVQAPDLTILSEAPLERRFYEDLDQIVGQRYSLNLVDSGRETHFYHIFVSSRWPLRLERQLRFTDGGGAVVEIRHPLHRIRILVVDGLSSYSRIRTPFLEQIARSVSRGGEAATNGPVDLVVGDLNAVGRSIGFDALRQASGGYQLASEFSLGWRATWPTAFPLLDIDHVWIGAGWRIRDCRMFSSFASDHRGQVVDLGSIVTEGREGAASSPLTRSASSSPRPGFATDHRLEGPWPAP